MSAHLHVSSLQPADRFPGAAQPKGWQNGQQNAYLKSIQLDFKHSTNF